MIWIKQFQGISYGQGGSGSAGIGFLSCAPDGSVYIAGSLMGTADFDPGAGIETRTSDSVTSIFLLKLDAAGNFVWVQSFARMTSISIRDLTTDNLGNPILMGIFNGTGDFDPGPEVFNSTATGGRDVFIEKFTEDGEFVWMKRIGGDFHTSGTSVTTGLSNEIYVTGNYFQTTDFDPGAATAFFTATGQDAFVLRLNASGAFSWVRFIGGNGGQNIVDAATDNSGMLYLAGEAVNSSTDYDPGPDVLTIPIIGQTNSFIVKLTNAGNLVWARTFTGHHTSAHCLEISDQRGIFLSGLLAESMDADPGSEEVILTGAFYFENYLVNLDLNGNYVWSGTFSSTTIDNYWIGLLSTDVQGNPVVAGYFQGTMDLEPGPDTAIHPSEGHFDMVILKLFPDLVGIEETDSQTPLIYPNPATGIISVAVPEEATISFYDSAGKLILNQVIDADKNTVDVSSFPAGIYIVEIAGEEKNYRQKLIRE